MADRANRAVERLRRSGAARPRAEHPGRSLARSLPGRRGVGCKHMPGSRRVRRRPAPAPVRRRARRSSSPGSSTARWPSCRRRRTIRTRCTTRAASGRRRRSRRRCPRRPPPPVPAPRGMAGASGARSSRTRRSRPRRPTRRRSPPGRTTAAPHLALAQLLAPHAAHQHDLGGGGGAPQKPPRARGAAARRRSASTGSIRGYQVAMQADPTSPDAGDESDPRSARRVGRLDAAEAGFQEMIRRKKEKETAEPLARYGDFLAEDKKDPLAAIEQYRQALIWVPDDDAARGEGGGDLPEDGARRPSPSSSTRWRTTASSEAAKYVHRRSIRQGQHARRLPGPACAASGASRLRTSVVPWPVLVDVDEPRLVGIARLSRSASRASPPTLQAVGGDALGGARPRCAGS